MPAARIWRTALAAPGMYEHSMMASGGCGKALMREICAAIEASPFLNVSCPSSLVPGSCLNIQSKPVQMPLSYSMVLSSST